MSDIKAFRTTITICVLCICPALVIADSGTGQPNNPPRTATLWGVFFNNPEACEHTPCTDAEFMREGNPAGIDVCFVVGLRRPTYGWSTFGGGFAEGTNFGCIYSGLGLQNAAAAEVHFVVQRHGRVRGDLLTDQVTEFQGGCPPLPCLDVHFAIHVATGEFDETVSEIYRFADASMIWGATSTLRRMEDGIKVAVNTRFQQRKDSWGMPNAD